MAVSTPVKPPEKTTASQRENTDEVEVALREWHRVAIQHEFAWKPWIEADNALFSSRCQCKFPKATILAHPCGDLCLCRPCYEMYTRDPSLSARCPRCNALVTKFEEIDLCDDDFRVTAPHSEFIEYDKGGEEDEEDE